MLHVVDSHCHLDRIDLKPYDGNLGLAIQAAKEQGVSHMLCVCISEENKQAVLDIAQHHKQVFASVGVHPCDTVTDLKDVVSVDTLMAWADAEKVIAIGETGLDYYHTLDNVSVQQESFKHHLLASAELGLPTIVHTRQAREDTIEYIKRYGNSDVAGVLHCFTENWEMASQALDLNYYISISGIVTFRNATELREVVRRVPLDRLLIETDSPYLAPVPHRGKPNEPKHVVLVRDYIAELLDIDPAVVAQQTTDNFFRLFASAQR